MTKRAKMKPANVKLSLLFSLSLVPGLLAMTGCDASTHPDDRGTPLWTLKGAITDGGSTPLTGELRVAFLWDLEYEDESVIGEDTVLAVAQDVPLQPEFPVHFTIDFFEPPPEKALNKWIVEGVGIAHGTIVAYEDRNGNGKLDLVGSRAPEFIDVIRGAVPRWMGEFAFIYIDSSEPVNLGPGFDCQPGLNILDPDSESDSVRFLPLDGTIEFTLTDDYWVRSLACREGVGSVDTSSDSIPREEEVAPGELGSLVDEVICEEDGRGAWGERCSEPVPTEFVCTVEEECQYYTATLAPDAPVPADWPCP
jgi:hypothetical protein